MSKSERSERAVELFNRALAAWPTTERAREQFNQMSEADQLEAVDHLAEWVKLQPAGDNISTSLWKYLHNRLWRQASPSESSLDILKRAAKAASDDFSDAASALPGGASPPANPVKRLPNGDQVAFGERPAIWIKRNDPRWSSAVERYRRERKVTPVAHSSMYFDGVGYAFPHSYFATV